MRKLIINGKEITAVNVTFGGTAAEKYAASEMRKYLSRTAAVKTTNGDYPITLSIDPSIGRDGFVIKPCGEAGLHITGGNGRGVIYGVYEFFEHFAGCRFFMPGLETLGEGDIVVDEEYAYTPVLEFRQSDWSCGSDLAWSVKNKINNRTIPHRVEFPGAMGGCQKYAGGYFAHTMTPFTGEEIPCLSDPKTLQKAIASVRDLLKSDPTATIVTVSQNDGYDHCTCEKCRAVEEEEGSPMGPLLRFVNAVADDIAQDYPNVAIDTLSYVYTRKPPRITRPRPNVCVRLCTFECCFIHPLSDPTCPENRKFVEDITAWNKICDRIYIWDYVTNFVYSVAPFPNFETLHANMRFFADHGMKGIYPEGNFFYGQQSGEFGELRCYLLAKLMWNPYMSAAEYDRHMNEFLAAYYGAGWQSIRAFIDFTAKEAKTQHFGIANRPFEMIPRERYEAMETTIDGWWDNAEALAGDRAEAVKRSRMQWRYIKLMLRPDAAEGQRFIDDLVAYNIAWSEWKSFPEDYDFTETPDRWLKNYPGLEG